MKFTDKVEKLLGDQEVTPLLRELGIDLSGYLSLKRHGHQPNAADALAVARRLNVSFEWLCCDAMDFPAPAFAPCVQTPEEKAASLSAEQLTHEIIRRLFALARDPRAEQFWREAKAGYEKAYWAAQRKRGIYPPSPNQEVQ